MKSNRWLLVYLALSVAIFVLLSLRRADLFSNPQFWAEDGTVFFYDQLTLGTAASLFHAYAGYCHVIERLIAGVASLFPPHSAPLIYSLAALTMEALCCSLFVLPSFRPLVRSDWLRGILCLYIATGIFAREMVGILTGMQWFLAVALVLVLVLPDDVGAPLLYVATAFCLLAGLSCGTTVFLAPIAIVKIWRKRNRAALPAIAVTLSALVQAFVLLTVPDPTRPSLPTLQQLAISTVVAFDYRVVLSSLVGCWTAVKTGRFGRVDIALAALAGAVAWVAALWWTGDRGRKWELVAFCYLTFATITSALYLRGLAPAFWPLTNITFNGERYFLFGCCFFAYLVAVSIERWLAWLTPAVQATILAVLLAGGVMGNYRIAPMEDYKWRESAPAVDQWLSDTKAHLPTRAVGFAVNPAPWFVVLPGTPGGLR